MKTAILMDMAGCPNRCKHCWLGHEPNGHVSIDDYAWVVQQFRDYQQNGIHYFDDYQCYSWYREPDYAENYKALWTMDKQLSTTTPIRWELASIWRLTRDSTYAPWLASLGVNAVQVTLFGGEANTDYFTGRKGAFHDTVKALDIMIAHGIRPMIQIFLYQRNVADLNSIIPLLTRLESRLEHLHMPLVVYIRTADPMGAGYDLEGMRITQNDLRKVPQYFIEKTITHENDPGFFDKWTTEKELLPMLCKDERPPGDTPNVLALMVSSTFNVYPNSGEIADYANLGNLRTDGIDFVMDRLIRKKTLSLHLNHETPVSYLAQKYGNPASEVLIDRYELCKKWLRMESENAPHQWSK